jgi:hypothetical protein
MAMSLCVSIRGEVSTKSLISNSLHVSVDNFKAVGAFPRRSQWPRGQGMKCLRLLEHWDRGFESR